MADELLQAIKCKNCGGAAFSDMKKEGFYCPYCHTLVSWNDDGKRLSKGIRYRHIPTGIGSNGGIKLEMAKGGKPVKNIFNHKEARARIPCISTKIAKYDPKTFAAWSDSETITISCPDCASQLYIKSTQNIFECHYCGNKHVRASSLKGKQYDKNLIIGDSCTYLPPDAIPFHVSRQQAIKATKSSIST